MIGKPFQTAGASNIKNIDGPASGHRLAWCTLD
jgi:hypothetical protein